MMQQALRWPTTLTLALLVWATCAHAECRLRLDLVPESSTFSLTGKNVVLTGTSEISGPITETPGVVKGLSGAVYAIAPSLPACPTTVNDWIAAMPKVTLTTTADPSWSSPLSTFPPVLPAKTIGYVYEPRQVEFDMNATMSGPASGNSIPLVLNFIVTQGLLYSSTPVTGTRVDVLTNYTSVSTATAVLSAEPSAGGTTLLTLRFPNLFLNLTSKPGVVQFPGQTVAWTTITGVYLNGSVLMQGRLGCPTYCGDRGRCVVSTAGTPVCQCECGWMQNATGACATPKGYCSDFNSNSNSSVIVQYYPAPPAPPSPPFVAPGPGSVDGRPQSVPPSGGGVCPADYGINLLGTSCELCKPGWAGQVCGLCQTDDACKTSYFLASATSQCVRSATYQQKSVAKNYTCTLPDPSVSGLLGNTLSFACSTLPPVNASLALKTVLTGSAGIISPAYSAVGTSPFCAMSFRMPTFTPGSLARCIGWGCEFARETSKVSCNTVQCDCPGGCTTTDGTDMSPTFTGVTGTIAISCQDAPAGSYEQDCSIDLTGLPIAAVQAKCSTSECYDPVSNLASLDFATDKDGIKGAKNRDPVIAAVPIMLITFATIACTAAYIIAAPYVKGTPKAPPAVSSTYPNDLAHGRPVAEGEETGEGNGATVELLPRGPNRTPSAALSANVAVEMRGLHSELSAVRPIGLDEEEERVSAGVVRGTHFRFLDIHVATQAPQGILSCCTGRAREPPKEILHGVSGSAGVGQVVGIMGPSGSGKSTLLNILSGQVRSGGAWKVTGTLQLGNTLLTADELVVVTAAVPQHDLLLKHLTVEEALRCSAALRLGPQVSAREAFDRVDQVLHELHMSDLRHRVGFKGDTPVLSGGERQRVSIGMELVTNPRILLLDEPTSGLDSYNALQVLRTLQSVAKGGRIVITSLHQPSPVLFHMLNKVLLVAKGHVVFSGAPNTAEEHFASLLQLPCPPKQVIAEHMLEVVGDTQTLPQLLQKVSQPTFTAHLHRLALLGDDPQSSSPSSSSDGDKQNTADLSPTHAILARGDIRRRRAPAPVLRQLGVLLWRSLTDVARNPMLLLMHIAFGIAIGLIVGFVYFRTKNDTAGAQNRVGGIFFCMNLFAFFGVTALDLLQQERQVTEREMLRRHYSPWLYMGVKLMVDSLLLRVLPSGIFSILFYWLMGLRPTAEAFFIFLFVFMTYTALIGAVALTCVAIIPKLGQALLVFTMLLLNFTLFTGFLVRKSSITWVFRWITYISPMRFTWEALVINELQPIILTLDIEGLPPVPPVQGRLFLSILGVDPDALTVCIIVLCCMYAGVMLMAAAFMALRVHRLRVGRA